MCTHDGHWIVDDPGGLAWCVDCCQWLPALWFWEEYVED